MRTSDDRNHDIEIMINDKADEVTKDFFNHTKIDIKTIWNQWAIVIFSLIMFICCIINVIK